MTRSQALCSIDDREDLSTQPCATSAQDAIQRKLLVLHSHGQPSTRHLPGVRIPRQPPRDRKLLGSTADMEGPVTVPRVLVVVQLADQNVFG